MRNLILILILCICILSVTSTVCTSQTIDTVPVPRIITLEYNNERLFCLDSLQIYKIHYIITRYNTLLSQVSDYHVLDSLQLLQINYQQQELISKDTIIKQKDNLIMSYRSTLINSSEPQTGGIDWTRVIITGMTALIGLITGFLIK